MNPERHQPADEPRHLQPQPWFAAPPVASAELATRADGSALSRRLRAVELLQAELQAGLEEQIAEQADLRRLCRHLRATQRCPGRCVFTGELRQNGMQVFRDALDGQP